MPLSPQPPPVTVMTSPSSYSSSSSVPTSYDFHRLILQYQQEQQQQQQQQQEEHTNDDDVKEQQQQQQQHHQHQSILYLAPQYGVDSQSFRQYEYEEMIYDFFCFYRGTSTTTNQVVTHNKAAETASTSISNHVDCENHHHFHHSFVEPISFEWDSSVMLNNDRTTTTTNNCKKMQENMELLRTYDVVVMMDLTNQMTQRYINTKQITVQQQQHMTPPTRMMIHRQIYEYVQVRLFNKNQQQSQQQPSSHHPTTMNDNHRSSQLFIIMPSEWYSKFYELIYSNTITSTTTTPSSSSSSSTSFSSRNKNKHKNNRQHVQQQQQKQLLLFVCIKNIPLNVQQQLLSRTWQRQPNIVGSSSANQKLKKKTTRDSYRPQQQQQTDHEASIITGGPTSPNTTHSTGKENDEEEEDTVDASTVATSDKSYYTKTKSSTAHRTGKGDGEEEYVAESITTSTYTTNVALVDKRNHKKKNRSPVTVSKKKYDDKTILLFLYELCKKYKPRHNLTTRYVWTIPAAISDTNRFMNQWITKMNHQKLLLIVLFCNDEEDEQHHNDNDQNRSNTILELSNVCQRYTIPYYVVKTTSVWKELLFGIGHFQQQDKYKRNIKMEQVDEVDNNVRNQIQTLNDNNNNNNNSPQKDDNDDYALAFCFSRVQTSDQDLMDELRSEAIIRLQEQPNQYQQQQQQDDDHDDIHTTSTTEQQEESERYEEDLFQQQNFDDELDSKTRKIMKPSQSKPQHLQQQQIQKEQHQQQPPSQMDLDIYEMFYKTYKEIPGWYITTTNYSDIDWVVKLENHAMLTIILGSAPNPCIATRCGNVAQIENEGGRDDDLDIVGGVIHRQIDEIIKECHSLQKDYFIVPATDWWLEHMKQIMGLVEEKREENQQQQQQQSLLLAISIPRIRVDDANRMKVLRLKARQSLYQDFGAGCTDSIWKQLVHLYEHYDVRNKRRIEGSKGTSKIRSYIQVECNPNKIVDIVDDERAVLVLLKKVDMLQLNHDDPIMDITDSCFKNRVPYLFLDDDSKNECFASITKRCLDLTTDQNDDDDTDESHHVICIMKHYTDDEKDMIDFDCMQQDLSTLLISIEQEKKDVDLIRKGRRGREEMHFQQQNDDDSHVSDKELTEGTNDHEQMNDELQETYQHTFDSPSTSVPILSSAPELEPIEVGHKHSRKRKRNRRLMFVQHDDDGTKRLTTAAAKDQHMDVKAEASVSKEMHVDMKNETDTNEMYIYPAPPHDEREMVNSTDAPNESESHMIDFSVPMAGPVSDDTHIAFHVVKEEQEIRLSPLQESNVTLDTDDDDSLTFVENDDGDSLFVSSDDVRLEEEISLLEFEVETLKSRQTDSKQKLAIQENHKDDIQKKILLATEEARRMKKAWKWQESVVSRLEQSIAMSKIALKRLTDADFTVDEMKKLTSLQFDLDSVTNASDDDEELMEEAASVLSSFTIPTQCKSAIICQDYSKIQGQRLELRNFSVHSLIDFFWKSRDNQGFTHGQFIGPLVSKMLIQKILNKVALEILSLDEIEPTGRHRREAMWNTCIDVRIMSTGAVIVPVTDKHGSVLNQDEPDEATGINPDIALCPYELTGKCADPFCSYQHLSPRTVSLVTCLEMLPLSRFVLIQSENSSVKEIKKKNLENETKKENENENTDPSSKYVSTGSITENDDFLSMPPMALDVVAIPEKSLQHPLLHEQIVLWWVSKDQQYLFEKSNKLLTTLEVLEILCGSFSRDNNAFSITNTEMPKTIIDGCIFAGMMIDATRITIHAGRLDCFHALKVLCTSVRRQWMKGVNILLTQQFFELFDFVTDQLFVTVEAHIVALRSIPTKSPHEILFETQLSLWVASCAFSEIHQLSLTNREEQVVSDWLILLKSFDDLADEDDPEDLDNQDPLLLLKHFFKRKQQINDDQITTISSEKCTRIEKLRHVIKFARRLKFLITTNPSSRSITEIFQYFCSTILSQSTTGKPDTQNITSTCILLCYCAIGALENAANRIPKDADVDHMKMELGLVYTAIDQALKLQVSMKPSVPLLDLLLAPIFAANIALACSIRLYNKAQARLATLLTLEIKTDGFVHQSSRLFSFHLSECLWSQLIQLQMTLPTRNTTTLDKDRMDSKLELRSDVVEYHNMIATVIAEFGVFPSQVNLENDWNIVSFLQPFLKNIDVRNGPVKTKRNFHARSSVLHQTLQGKKKEIMGYSLRNRALLLFSKYGEPSMHRSALPHSLIMCGASLNILNLSNCSLKVLSANFGYSFPKLKVRIWSSSVTSNLCTPISNVSHKHFDISQNDLEEIPSSMTNIKSLKMLNVTGNKIVAFPNNFGPPALTSLHAANNRITTLPRKFTNCVNLVTLNLDGNPVDNTFWFLAASFSKLQELLPSKGSSSRKDLC